MDTVEAHTPIVARTPSACAVFSEYRKELEEGVEVLRQRQSETIDATATLINDTQAQLEPAAHDAVETLQDMSEVSTPVSPMVAAFSWSAFLVLSWSIGSMMGSFVVGPIIGLFIGKSFSATIAMAVVPIAMFMHIRQNEKETDAAVRFHLLGMALVQGIFSGHAIEDLYLSAQPMAFITPLVVSVAYPQAVHSFGDSRKNLLACTLGAAFGAQFATGFISGYLTLPFLFLTLLYTAAAGVVMQFVFKHVKAPEQRMHLYQLGLLTSFVFIKCFVFGLFGSTHYAATH